MRKLLAYWPAAALFLVVAWFAVWPRIGPRIVGGPVRPRIVGLPPSLDDVPSGGADSAFAYAPAPHFASLTRARHSRFGDDTVTYELVAARGWRSVVHLGQDHDYGTFSSGSDEWYGGAWDLFRSVLAHQSRTAENGLTLLRVDGVSEVRGRLFPLAVGNRLSFRTDIRSQIGGRVKELRGNNVELRVTGTTEVYAHAEPAVPGPVFVIERRLLPDGRTEIIHYAAGLGAAVYEETPFGDVERLVAWH